MNFLEQFRYLHQATSKTPSGVGSFDFTGLCMAGAILAMLLQLYLYIHFFNPIIDQQWLTEQCTASSANSTLQKYHITCHRALLHNDNIIFTYHINNEQLVNRLQTNRKTRKNLKTLICKMANMQQALAKYQPIDLVYLASDKTPIATIKIFDC